MNKGIVLLGVAGIGTLLYFANKGRGATKLDFYFNTVDLSDLKLSSYKITTSMTVVNPTNTEQKIDAVFGNVFLPDGSQLGRIEQTTVQTIDKRGSSIIATPVIIFPAGLGKLAGLMIQNRGALPKLTIKGTVVSLGISIPFQQVVG